MTRAGSADTLGAGKWVATKDGKVLASSPDLRQLVARLRSMGRRAYGAVARYECGEVS